MGSAMLNRSKAPHGTTGRCFKRSTSPFFTAVKVVATTSILKFDGTRGPAPLLDSQRGVMPRAGARLSRSGPCSSSSSTLGRARPIRWRNEEKLADVCRSSKLLGAAMPAEHDVDAGAARPSRVHELARALAARVGCAWCELRSRRSACPACQGLLRVQGKHRDKVAPRSGAIGFTGI